MLSDTCTAHALSYPAQRAGDALGGRVPAQRGGQGKPPAVQRK